MRAVAVTVEAAASTPTPYGGLTAAWVDVATVWVELARSAPASSGSTSDAPPQRLERAQAAARTHPALAPGVRLNTGDGPPWSVTTVRDDEPVPGRCVLLLERLL